MIESVATSKGNMPMSQKQYSFHFYWFIVSENSDEFQKDIFIHLCYILSLFTKHYALSPNTMPYISFPPPFY